MLGGGLSIEPVLPEDFLLALESQRSLGIMTIDSLHLAVARRLGLLDFATADRGFSSAQGFNIHRPSDFSLEPVEPS